MVIGVSILQRLIIVKDNIYFKAFHHFGLQVILLIQTLEMILIILASGQRKTYMKI